MPPQILKGGSVSMTEQQNLQHEEAMRDLKEFLDGLLNDSCDIRDDEKHA